MATSGHRCAALALALAACSRPDEPEPEDLRTILGLPDHFELPAIPEFNPPTRAKIELGRHLFYDRRLSGNGTQACAGCHLQEHAFADGMQRPTGSTGTVLERNSQGLANVAYNASLTWANNGLLELEDQIQVPLRADDPIELGVTDAVVDEVLERFDADPEYMRMFTEAFPDSDSGATINKIVFALASFCRSLISGDSPYDRYVAGDRDALTVQQKLGMSLFSGERFECFHCHGGTFATASYRDEHIGDANYRLVFFNNGLYNVDGKGSYPEHDQGLYDVTLDPNHRGLFRPPSLRNIALTAPYMHDGSIATLREVVEHYAAGGRVLADGPFAGDGRVSPLKSGLVRGFEATDAEIDAVIAFLESMTDPNFVGDPAFSDPFKVK